MPKPQPDGHAIPVLRNADLRTPVASGVAVQGILTALQTILGCACLYTLSASVLDVASAAAVASEPLRAASTRARPPLRGFHEIGHYRVIVERDLFAAPALPDAAGEPAPEATATATRLPLQLRGTTVMSDASRSLAVIEDTRTSETTVVATGDPIGEARVERIERERVLVSHAGRRELIVFPNERRSVGSAGPGRDRRPAEPGARPRSESRRSADRVRRQGPQRAVASSPPPTDDLRGLPPASADPRQASDEALQELSRQARFLPDFGDVGRLRGIRVSDIRSGSALERVGLRNGDVVLSIGGTRIEGTEQLAPTLRGLDVSRGVALEVERDGGLMQIDVPAGSL